MIIEEYLKDLKEDYEKTDATWHLKMSGWNELSKRIGLLETPRRKSPFLYFAVGFAVLLIFLAGTIQIAQAALPGDTLYPVKILSEKFIEGTSGNNQIVIDHRAQEIVGLSNKDQINSENLKQAVTEYKISVDQAKHKSESDGKLNENLTHKLEKQHSQFEQIGREHPDIQKEIEDAKDASDNR